MDTYAKHVLEATIEEQNGTQDHPLEILYTRIGTGGTVLSGEEHIFSLIKYRWPQAHDSVYKLYLNRNIGQILKPTEIVMTAVRLARADLHVDDMPKPRVTDFRRWLQEGASALQQSPLLERLQAFVTPPDLGPSRLQAAFECFRGLIDYRPKNALEDLGLPKVFVPHLNLPAIQVVLRWIDLNWGCDAAFFQSSRRDILRFLLFWHIAVHNEDASSNAVFKDVFKELKRGDNFPGRSMYGVLTKGDGKRGQSFAYCLPDPQTLRAALGEKRGRLRDWAERFNPEPFLQRWWFKKELLLWLQRQWIDPWLDNYDPLAGRDEDRPYDYDHILPRDHWLYYSLDGEFSDTEARQRFDRYRDLLGNSIGNYRVWLSRLNRSDGPAAPSSKLYLEANPSDLLPDGDWPKNLKTVADLRAASIIGTDDKDLWIKASGDDNDPKRWSYDRVEAFQTAVEKRVAWLYERFYNELAFDLWA